MLIKIWKKSLVLGIVAMLGILSFLPLITSASAPRLHEVHNSNSIRDDLSEYINLNFLCLTMVKGHFDRINLPLAYLMTFINIGFFDKFPNFLGLVFFLYKWYIDFSNKVPLKLMVRSQILFGWGEIRTIGLNGYKIFPLGGRGGDIATLFGFIGLWLSSDTTGLPYDFGIGFSLCALDGYWYPGAWPHISDNLKSHFEGINVNRYQPLKY